MYVAPMNLVRGMAGELFAKSGRTLRLAKRLTKECRKL